MAWAAAAAQGPLSVEPRARARVAPPRIGNENPPTQPERGRGGWLWLTVLYALWRWRRQLSPPAALTAMVLVALIGHAASEGLAWLPLLAGAGSAGWLALRAHRPIHRWYVVGAAAAGSWVAAAWWVGLGDPVILAGLIALAIGGPAVWWAHHLPRSRVVIVGGSRWPWRWAAYRFQQRHKRLLSDRIEWWAITAQQAKVPRVQARQAIADTTSPDYVLVVDLHGHAVSDLTKGRNWIESGLRARRATLRIEQDPDWAHLARIVWRRDDAGEGEWKPEVVSAKDEDTEEAS